MLKNKLNDIKLNNFIAIDIETTGTDVKIDKIIEIAACKYSNGKLTNTFSTLINPNKNVSSFITDLTGISNNDLKDKP